ncbi:MAG: amidase, partial [Bacteroidota bacterium]
MHKYLYLVALLVIFSCKQTESNPEKDILETDTTEPSEEVKQSESDDDLSDISTKDFREFKVLDSKHLTNEEIWKDLDAQMTNFSQADHDRLKPLILEQDIPTIQASISDGKFSYED